MHRIARRYLERVRLGDQASKYPPQLSGGQQQRAVIARALCMEPTSSLDPFMDEGQIIEIAATEQFFAAPRSERLRAFLSQILH